MLFVNSGHVFENFSDIFSIKVQPFLLFDKISDPKNLKIQVDWVVKMQFWVNVYKFIGSKSN